MVIIRARMRILIQTQSLRKGSRFSAVAHISFVELLAFTGEVDAPQGFVVRVTPGLRV